MCFSRSRRVARLEGLLGGVDAGRLLVLVEESRGLSENARLLLLSDHRLADELLLLSNHRLAHELLLLADCCWPGRTAVSITTALVCWVGATMRWLWCSSTRSTRVVAISR